ncbi:taurine ABC transporter substrate-binding protein [Butyrivibrio sp.]|jgi:taurine transport system substrate-binding protein|uniref:taurine ABC transporter substrate-binding protein n=1 Tax=Butyrivibrio sp. TaxID=28121 RepID=UPI0025C194C7|nr:ABC transporter substrate-binding protein [Butyrivibrio sp.]MBE5837075.1 taurine ABC transporter substrate-binding protein [Butyrivibrio sp.]
MIRNGFIKNSGRLKARKTSIVVMLLALSTLFFIGCGHNERNENLPEKVIIGTQTLADPEGIAKAEGWLEAQMGIPVEIVKFDGGRDVNMAMASGEIDFGLLGSVPAALAISNDVDCKVIYIQSVLGDIESLMVNPKLGIKNAGDLKGKTVATVFSSTSHYSLLKYLECNNVSAEDVDIIDMNASSIVAAYQRGDIDAAFIWDPQVTELEKLGALRLTSAKELSNYGYATMDVEIVSTKFAENYPFLVQKYISLMDQAVRLYKSDPDEAGLSLSKDLGIDKKTCINQIESSLWLTCDEQKGTQWFGSDSLANTLYETAVFLYEQGDVLEEPKLESFREKVDSEFINGVE